MIKFVRFAQRILSASLAYRLIRFMGGYIKRPAIRESEQNALERAQKIVYGKGQVAWSWGCGPMVILVHGWSGRAAQMAPLASHIAGLGFRAIAIDVTGHGDSPQSFTRWQYFFDDITAISRSLNEPVHAYVGHSAGAMTLMAARRLRGINASRYVCISAPSHPYLAIEFLREKLNPEPSVLESYKKFIAADFDATWAQLENGLCYQDDGGEVLLCFDTQDRIVAYSEGEKIQGVCPRATLVKSGAYSHMQILASPELADNVGRFLQGKPVTGQE